VGFLKVTDNVYALDSTKGNYAYLIFGEEIILIDTGRPGQGKGILNDLKSVGIEPQDVKHILITHHDVDHIGSLAFLQQATGAKIWASKEDIPYIYGEKNRPGIKKLISYIMRVKKPENINLYPEDGKMGDIVVIAAPGHTPGHVCIIYNGVLFAGDLFRTSKGKIAPMKSFMNWNDSVLKESLVKIDNYDFEWICPAHGEPLKRNGQLKELY
jgi:glyoxylase-like metal-dependent hydrolase (beta-lactamase superfamily II)